MRTFNHCTNISLFLWPNHRNKELKHKKKYSTGWQISNSKHLFNRKMQKWQTGNLYKAERCWIIIFYSSAFENMKDEFVPRPRGKNSIRHNYWSHSPCTGIGQQLLQQQSKSTLTWRRVQKVTNCLYMWPVDFNIT